MQVAFVKKGTELIKVNGSPISLLQPEILKLKTYEPILLPGSERFSQVDISVRCKGGGTTGQIYAIRQAIAKGIVAYYQKYVDKAFKKDILVEYDRTISLPIPEDANPRSSEDLELRTLSCAAPRGMATGDGAVGVRHRRWTLPTDRVDVSPCVDSPYVDLCATICGLDLLER